MVMMVVMKEGANNNNIDDSDGAGDDDDGDRSRQVAARPVSRDRGQESSLATVVEIAAPVGNQPRQGGPVQARCAPTFLLFQVLGIFGVDNSKKICWIPIKRPHLLLEAGAAKVLTNSFDQQFFGLFGVDDIKLKEYQ